MVLLALALFNPSGRAEGGPEFFTEDLESLAPGQSEVVAGVSYARGGGARSLAMPEVEIAYGLTTRWVLEAELELESLRPAGGQSKRELEGTIGAKWLAYANRTAGVAVGLFPQVQFDTAPGLSLPQTPLVEDVGYRVPLLFAKSLGGVTLSTELGYTWRTKRADQWSAGLALEHEFGDEIEIGAECYSLWSPGLSQKQIAIGLGAAFELTKRFQLLATLGRDLGNDFGPRATLRGFLGVRWSR